MTELARDYERQLAWRRWDEALRHLPDVSAHRVLDLGCGIGDQADLLARRGARVVGIDINADLLQVAREKSIAGAEFKQCDLRAIQEPVRTCDGLWSSFTVAYFPQDLEQVLGSWVATLRQGGWLMLVEVDDLFAHTPLPARTAALLEAYVEDALHAGRYDFRMGRKLTDTLLRRVGCEFVQGGTLPDKELSFQGPCSADVVNAWTTRWDRMAPLKAMAGSYFDEARRDFLAALCREEHRTTCTVRWCLGRRM